MHDPKHRSRTSSESGRPLKRSFLDAEGTHWHVYERAFADYDRRSGVSLIFESESAVRRVRHFPVNWHDLSEEELAALSWMA
jgi:hypothetical protein